MTDTITSIARDLGIDLTPRDRDDLDFHQVHVATLRRALEAAYRAGERSADPVVSFFTNPHGGWVLRGAFGTQWATSTDAAAIKLRAILGEKAG